MLDDALLGYQRYLTCVQQQESPEEEPENLDPDSDKSEGDIIDEITGQMKLF